jgi:hypothetical protein
MPSREGWLEHLGPVAVQVITLVIGWPGVCAGVSVVFVALVYRLLAEWQRRKTLLATYLYAPAGTIVVQGHGPAGAPLWVRVGGGSPSTVIVWVTSPGCRRVLLWRRWS